jgi:hypothetical protein
LRISQVSQAPKEFFMPTAKRTFRPPKSTVLTAALGWIGAFSLPAVIVLSLGVVPTGPRREIPLGGPARITVAGLLFAAGLGGAIRSALVGITYSHDFVTVVNFFRTWRIPTSQVSQFAWTETGLEVQWHDTAGQPHSTPVAAFNTERNTMVDVDGAEAVHRELEALRTGSP